jgi:hypothetical protein
MGRIPAVAAAEAGVIGRLVYRLAQRRFGEVPEPFAVARHHRRLFWAGLMSESAYRWAARVLGTHHARGSRTSFSGLSTW